MVRTHSRAHAMLPTPGNNRRNSTTADSSPRCSNAVRITAACASLMQNIDGERFLRCLRRGLDRSFHIRPGAARLAELNHHEAELRVLAHEVHYLMAGLRL